MAGTRLEHKGVIEVKDEEIPTVRAEREEIPLASREEREDVARTRPLEEMRERAPWTPGETETVVLGGPPPSFAYLIIKDGPRAGRLFRLNPKGTTVGRDWHNDIILDDEAVSRQHAKIRVEGEGDEEKFFLYDLASTNGTFVNGKQILKHALEDGDEIVMGETTLVFKRISGGT